MRREHKAAPHHNVARKRRCPDAHTTNGLGHALLLSPALPQKLFFQRGATSDCSRASMRGYGAVPQVASAPGCEAGRRRRRAVCAVALLAGLCAGVALAMSSGANAQTSLLALMTMVPLRVIRPAVRSRLNLPRSLRMKVDVFLSHSRFFFSFFSLSPSLSLSLFLSLSVFLLLACSLCLVSLWCADTYLCVCARLCVQIHTCAHIQAGVYGPHPSDALEFDQFSAGFPAKPTPSWNPSDALVRSTACGVVC